MFISMCSGAAAPSLLEMMCTCVLRSQAWQAAMPAVHSRRPQDPAARQVSIHPCTAGGGQYKGMPSLPVRPPKALPILPTPPTPAPEPPSVHAVPGPQPMNIDDHETAAQRGGGNGMVRTLSSQSVLCIGADTDYAKLHAQRPLSAKLLNERLIVWET